MDAILLTQLDQALLGPLRVALYLVDDGLDFGGAEQPCDFGRGEVGYSCGCGNESATKSRPPACSDGKGSQGLPICLTFPVSTSFSIAAYVASKARESSMSMMGCGEAG